MKTLTVTVPTEQAQRILEELQALGVLTIQDTSLPYPGLPPRKAHL